MILANQRCLDQALDLLDRVDDERYRASRAGWSPVAAQLRHVIEHYQCFLEGLPAGRIDYDARRRDPTIERSRARAREAVLALRAGFDAVTGPLDRPMAVQMQCAADDPAPVWCHSTVGRELQFLVSHSVHHFALIRLLVEPDGVDLGEEFGIAPSTLAHTRHR
jgi:hypothetical protein